VEELWEKFVDDETTTTDLWLLYRTTCCAFRALTLLVEWQEGHSAYKNLSGKVLVWLSVCSKVKMIRTWSS